MQVSYMWRSSPFGFFALLFTLAVSVTACSEGSAPDNNMMYGRDMGQETSTPITQTSITSSTATSTATAGTSTSTATATATMASNAKPVAVIKPPVAPLLVGQPVVLDAVDSSDEEGGELSYAWRLIRGPQTEPGTLTPLEQRATTLTSQLAGEYEVGLVVTDPEGLASDEATLVLTLEEPPVENKPPVAAASAMPQAALVGQTVTLNASDSMDPNGDELSFQWSMVQMPPGSNAQIMNNRSSVATIVPDLAGSYEMSVIVSDGKAEDSIRVTLSASLPNRQPVAAITLPAQVVVGTPVTLDGSGSTDPDQDVLTYSWKLITDPSLGSDLVTAKMDAKAALVPSVVGDYIVELEVSDPDGLSDKTTATLKVVAPPNTNPVAQAGADQTVVIGTPVTLDGSASSDAEDTPAGIILQGIWMMRSSPTGANVTLSNPMALTTTFTPDRVGVYRFLLTVQDQAGATASDEILINVTPPPNTPPVANAGPDQTALTLDTVTLDGSASTDLEDDAASRTLVYLWQITSAPMGSAASLSSTTAITPSLIPDKPGTYTINLRVTDFNNASATDSVSVVVTQRQTPPVAQAGPTQSVAARALVMLDGSASTDAEDDPAGLALSYQWSVESEPANSSVSLAGAQTTSPTFSPLVGGTYQLRLTVTDSHGLSHSDVVTVTVTNLLPVANCGLDQTARVGDAVMFDASSSSDVEDDADGVMLDYSWSIEKKPAGSLVTLSVTDQAQTTVTPDIAGVYELRVTVSDSGQLSASDTVILTVTPPNAPPVAVVAGDGRIEQEGATVTLDASGSTDREDDATGSALSYLWSVVSAPGLAPVIQNATSSQAGATLSDLGEYTFNVVVTDSEGLSHDTTLKITVYPDTSSDCLFISEVVEGTGSNRAVEIYNCGAATLNLYPYQLCPVLDGATSCSMGEVAFAPGASVPAGGTWTVCDPAIDKSLFPIGMTDCDQYDALAFDGDDRLHLYEDKNNSGGFDSVSDDTVDAFGELVSQPATPLWADAGFTRCFLTPFSGMGAFSVESFYDPVALDDLQGLGQVPTPGCRSADQPPVADAGNNVSGWRGQALQVDGRASTDAEDDLSGTPLTYSWALISSPTGSNPTLMNTTMDVMTLSAVTYGVYELELTVTDSLGQQSTDRVDVVVQCVLISEVMEGSSNNKAVELANCGDRDVQLTGVHLCQANNSGMSCTPSRDLALSGALAPDETLLLCNTNLDLLILPMGVSCDVFESNVITFNGNDRLLLYHEEDTTTGYSAGDRPLDAFGQTSVDPGSVWSDTTYTRCGQTYYDGVGPFTPAPPEWEVLTMLNDTSGLGVAFSGCP